MLLELIPPSSTLSPFRLFIDFADLNHGHPNPFAWSSQLGMLLQHDLDLPRSMHMLDKAVGRTTLLDVVRFDLRTLNSGLRGITANSSTTSSASTAVTSIASSSSQKGLVVVRCEFVDGGFNEWTLPIDFSSVAEPRLAAPFVKRIRSILKDLQLMHLEEERAKLAAQYERLSKHRPNSHSLSTNMGGQTPVGGSAGPSLAKRLSVQMGVMRHSSSMSSLSTAASSHSEIPVPKNHKRQRSLLKSLVGSIKKMNSTSTLSSKASSSSLHRSTSSVALPSTSQTEDADPEAQIVSSSTHTARAQHHREKVRSALVDTYRRFVLASLSSSKVSPSLSLESTPTSTHEGGSRSPTQRLPAAFLAPHEIVDDEEDEGVDSDEDEEDSSDESSSDGGSEGSSTSSSSENDSDEDSDEEEEEAPRPPPTRIPMFGKVTLTAPSAKRHRPRTPAVFAHDLQGKGSESKSSQREVIRPYERNEPFSYYTWVLKSMLRRTEHEMAVLKRDAQAQEAQRKQDEMDPDALLDTLRMDEAERLRLLTIRQRELEAETLEKDLKTRQEEEKRRREEEWQRLAGDEPKKEGGSSPSRLKKPSLLRKRSESTLTTSTTTTTVQAVPPVASKFSFGGLIKRKSKSQPVLSPPSAETSKSASGSRIPRLSSKASFPPPSPTSPTKTASSPPTSPTSSIPIRKSGIPAPRRIHFAPPVVAPLDKEELQAALKTKLRRAVAEDVTDDVRKFSPITMEVPSSFSDSEGEEGCGGLVVAGSALEVEVVAPSTPTPAVEVEFVQVELEAVREEEEDPNSICSLSAHSKRTSSCSSTISEMSVDSTLTVSTAPTSPSVSPPLPHFVASDCTPLPAIGEEDPGAQDEFQEAEKSVLPEASLQREEDDMVVVSVAPQDDEDDEGQEIECGFAVTCDEAVELSQPSASDISTLPISSIPQSTSHSVHTQPPQTPSPGPSPPPTPTQQQVFSKPLLLPPSYTRLEELSHKLRSLLIFATVSAQAIKDEEERVLDLLEMRGKRRAWSGGAFVRGVSSKSAHQKPEGRAAWAFAVAKKRADEKKRELKAKLKEEKRAERVKRKREEAASSNAHEGSSDDEEDLPSPGLTLVNANRRLPPLPIFALSSPTSSSPLACCPSFTASDKDAEGLVYVPPIKEQTIFYTWSSKHKSSFEIHGPLPSRRNRMSLDGLERSIMSSRELKARRNQRMAAAAALAPDEGFVEFEGGVVDEDGFVYANEFAHLHDAERSAHGFPLLGPRDGMEDEDEDDDGIEWQSPVGYGAGGVVSPPLSPTSMDAMIPPRPRLLPSTVHAPHGLLPLEEDVDEEDEDDMSPPSSARGALTGSGSSTPVQSDDDDEFEFDRLRMSTPRFEPAQDQEPTSPIDEDDDEDDDDKEFYADISDITQFVDGLDRKTRERPVRKVSGSESTVFHRQRKRMSGGSLPEDVAEVEPPPSPVESDREEEQPRSPSTTRRTRNHRRQWQTLEEEDEGREEGARSLTPPLSPVDEQTEERSGSGMRISLEAERPMPIGSGKLKIRPRDRTRSMYKRLSPISPPPPPKPVLGRRTVSEPLISKESPPTSPVDEAPRTTNAYIPYGRVEIGSSRAPLSEESLLCQPVRFSHLPAGCGTIADDHAKPIIKLVTKTVAASPPPPHPSPPVFSLLTPRLKISVPSKELVDRVDSPDVPRSPSPSPISRSPSPPAVRPLSPSLSLDGSVLSAQSSIGPITPIDEFGNPIDPPPYSEEGSAVCEEFTLAMDVRDRKMHVHQQQVKKQTLSKKVDGLLAPGVVH